MEMQFRNLDRAIDSQPMPSHFRDTKALVYCNDCAAKTSVNYHWLGLKCAVCDSYNTAQIQILSGPNPQPLPLPNAENAARPPRPDDLVLPSSTSRQSQPRGRHGRGLPPIHLNTPSSSHRRPTSSSSAMENVRSSPYPVTPRMGRSASPFRNFGGDINIHTAAATDEEEEHINTEDEEEEEEEEEIAFWGGDGPRSRSRPEEEQESFEDENDSIVDDEEDIEDGDGDDDDGDDANDQMELFGHR
ncbi:MAG: hypothetical protein M1835_005486 [Candelina submexicana]|nr:MAG: hypothetical protein M1835_005486 [Candelina submexicana]